jgi:hypothetical protein
MLKPWQTIEHCQEKDQKPMNHIQFQSLLAFWTSIIEYSKAKLKSNGAMTPPSFRPLENASDKRLI